MGLRETVELWMLRLAGLPVSESWDRPPGPLSKKQIAITACALFVQAVGAISFALSLNQGDYNAFETYTKLNGIIFPVSAIYVILNMASADRSAPKRLSVRSKCLREAMMEHGLGVGATDLCRLVSVVLLAMALLSFCLDCVLQWSLTVYFNQTASALNQLLNKMLTVLTFPGELLFWTVLYRTASQPLAELGVVQDLIRELSVHETDPDLNAVVELAPDLGPGQLVAPPLTVDRCRLLIEVCDQANKLRLESNQWLHIPSCIMTMIAAWYFPIVLWGLNTSSERSFFNYANRAYIGFGLIGKLAPCFCAQLVKMRREVLVQKAGREANRSSDPDLKRALKKLKIHAEEMFPDCLCVLMDIDLSLLAVFANVVVLVFTTFFTREGP